MKYFELTKEEQKLLAEFEKGNFVSVKDFAKQKKLFEKYARNTLNKTKNINIRLSEKDLYKLKARAVRDGIPYQTLVSSILHRFTNE